MVGPKVILWKPLILTVVALLIASVVIYFFNPKLSIILVLAALGLISRIPAGISTYLNPLEMIDFFGVSIALSYGPIYGAIFSLVLFIFSRIFLPGEWPMYTIKWALTIFMGAFVFYYLFPVVGSISTLFTIMILWNTLSYTFILTPLLERDALMTEIYYDIMLSPIAILHRIIISFVGGEFLHELLISGSPKVAYLYVFAAVFAAVLWFGKDIIKKFNEAASKSNIFTADKPSAIRTALSRIGIDKGELKGIILAIVVLSLALTAGQWGDKTFSAADGIKNMFIAIPVVALSFMAHEWGHKLAAIKYGVRAFFKPAWPMMAFSAVIGIISGGWAVITAVGNPILTNIKRLGFKSPEIGPKPLANIIVAGPLVSLFLVLLSKVLIGAYGETTMLKDLYLFNLWMLFFNIIPLVVPSQKGSGMEKTIFPPFDGAFVLGGSPPLFFAFAGFAIGTVAALAFLPLWLAISIGLALGLVLLAYIVNEKGLPTS